jgi:hypothetical protein
VEPQILGALAFTTKRALVLASRTIFINSTVDPIGYIDISLAVYVIIPNILIRFGCRVLLGIADNNIWLFINKKSITGAGVLAIAET